ncbi:MAG: hypothetical protein HLUCCA01_10355 [Bacteroidetes bacterium HLUCCA01]|nr:MAG: hypothetical protein HLUCCA01_10355 [Bacteroidetes bacterium HLUCCA01]
MSDTPFFMSAARFELRSMEKTRPMSLSIPDTPFFMSAARSELRSIEKTRPMGLSIPDTPFFCVYRTVWTQIHR